MYYLLIISIIIVIICFLVFFYYNKTDQMNNSFWDDFYKSTTNIENPSSFAIYVYNNYIKKYNDMNIFLKIADLGAGNCRDSNFFAKAGNYCNAIDINGVNNNPIKNCILLNEDVEDVLKTFKLKTLFDIIYMRWFLHAMPYDKSASIFNNAVNNLKPGGIICIEVRSLNDTNLILSSKYDEKDKSYFTTHKRWPYNQEMLNNLIKNKDLDILYNKEDYFSPNNNTETSNPLLIRLILKKKVLPYYEQSENYNIYKHIIGKMRDQTMKTYYLMNKINSIFEKHDIQYVATAGTLIGLNRHGGIIPWDNDIDIGFVDSEWDKLLNIKKELEDNGFKYNYVSNNHCHFGVIDCFKFTLKGECYEGDAKTYIHKDEYNNRYKQIYAYTTIYAPFDCTKTLTYRYGKSYFTEGDVNDNFHFRDNKVPRFKLNYNDRSFQTFDTIVSSTDQDID